MTLFYSTVAGIRTVAGKFASSSCGEIQSAGRQPGAGKVSQVPVKSARSARRVGQVRAARQPGTREASAKSPRGVSQVIRGASTRWRGDTRQAPGLVGVGWGARVGCRRRTPGRGSTLAWSTDMPSGEYWPSDNVQPGVGSVVDVLYYVHGKKAYFRGTVRGVRHACLRG